VKYLHGGEAWIAETDHPALVAASNAVRRAYGKTPVFTREGGSIPIINTFAAELKVPCALLGIGLPDDGLHAPNEKLDLDQFYKGIAAAAYMMEEFGAVDLSAAPAAKPAAKPAKKAAKPAKKAARKPVKKAAKKAAKKPAKK